MSDTLVSSTRQNRRLAAVVAAVLGLSLAPSEAATFTWVAPNTGTWSTGTNWTGGIAPTGADAGDVLIFGGPVGTVAGTSPNYISTNNFAQPFLLNQIQLEASDPSGVGPAHTIAGAAGASIVYGGVSPQLLQNGTGGVTFTLPVHLGSSLTVGGTGSGTATLNSTVSGLADITKTGPGILRFGSLNDLTPSANTWMGGLDIQQGTVRFNNNASSARTALRGNAVSLGTSATLMASSELRIGNLSGTGRVETLVSGTNADSESIVIYTLRDSTFGGAVSIGAPTGTGGTDGTLTVRGSGTQTLTGSVGTSGGDVQVGYSSKLVLAGTASLSNATKGAVVLNGGSFILDNTGTNLTNTNNGGRVRGTAADVDSTGLDTIGGGVFSLIGNSSGTQEYAARIQLGSVNNSGTISKPRSGAVTINVTHTAASAATVLTFASYTRDSTSLSQFTTVDFTAQDGNGAALTLGQTGGTPRIMFGTGFSVPLSVASTAGLLKNTNLSADDIGWATVNGTDFASYNSANGITAATTAAFPTNGISAGNANTNYAITGGVSQMMTFNAQSIKITPNATGQTLTLGSGTSMNTRGFLLAGSRDYTIGGTGSIGGTSSTSNRYFHVQEAVLNVTAPITGNGAIVKAGAGTLALSNTNNAAHGAALIVNSGVVRGSNSSLPSGELRFRGGVLEITGGGTFSRTVGIGSNSVNWSGFDGISGIDEDRGSGGFAAFGSDVTLDLGGSTQTGFAWEDAKFVNSGHALVFGSRRADRKIDWVDDIGLSATSGTVNYNARELRVIGHADSSVQTDRLQISGKITGSVQNDLLKTGDGVLELSGANAYQGATIVREGTLLVNSSIASSFLTDVHSGAKLGGRGTVGAVRVQGGGTFAPGEIAGFTGQTSGLTINGDLRFTGATSKFEFELEAGSHDKANVNGGVFLEGAQLLGSLLNGFIGAPNDLFFLIINDGTDAVQGQFAQGSSINVGGQLFEIGYAGDSLANSFTGGNDVVLRAIPEPSSALLIGSGLLLLGGRRRRR